MNWWMFFIVLPCMIIVSELTYQVLLPLLRESHSACAGNCVTYPARRRAGITQKLEDGVIIKLHRSGATARLMDVSKETIRELATDPKNYACYAYCGRHWIAFNTTSAFMGGGGGHCVPDGRAHKLWLK